MTLPGKKWGKKYEKNYNYTMKLLCETSKEVIYYNGELICPYYHELSAGVTNSGEYKYLKSVDSSIDKENSKFLNISYFSAEDLIEKLKDVIKEDASTENISSKISVNYEDNGEYVRSVNVGDNVMLMNDWQKIFELQSAAFSIEEFSGGIKITSKGKGDEKGLSINEALELAKDGKGYRDILKHYFTNVEIR